MREDVLKVKCSSKEESKQIQEHAFKIGYEWLVNTKYIVDTLYIFCDGKGKMRNCSTEDFFDRDNSFNVTPNQFLQLKKVITERSNLPIFNEVLTSNLFEKRKKISTTI